MDEILHHLRNLANNAFCSQDFMAICDGRLQLMLLSGRKDRGGSQRAVANPEVRFPCSRDGHHFARSEVLTAGSRRGGRERRWRSDGTPVRASGMPAPRSKKATADRAGHHFWMQHLGETDCGVS